MTEFKTEDLIFEGTSVLSAPVEGTLALSDPVSDGLSGITLNQNGELTDAAPLTSSYLWQTFRFPADYPRGVSGGAVILVPKLTGFHVNVNVTEDLGPAASLDWVIDYWHPDRGWVGVARGTQVGAPSDGEKIWFSVTFPPVDITNFWWRKFRLGIAGREGNPENFRVLVPYDEENRQVTINNKNIDVIPDISPAPLVEGQRYVFDLEGTPSILEIVGGDAYYSEQQGIEEVLYTSPNPYQSTSSQEFVQVNASAIDAANLEFEEIQNSIPFATPALGEDSVVSISRTVGSDIKAFDADGVTPLQHLGQELSLRFRILTTASDVDRDCTGSLYRTVAIQSTPQNVRTSVGDLQDAFWLSAPNPSQFACEALYFDVSKEDTAQVVDHILIDPLTPGIFMNVYYSNDVLPGDSTDAWDGLLWTRIDKQFSLQHRESYALPEPITAKYIKLEFTRLQPSWYAPGTFQLPTPYRKHPKWVMDYYLSLYQQVRSNILDSASTVNVSFDALELAYQYYLDDLRQDVPSAPATIQGSEEVSLLSNFLTKEQIVEINQVDATTLAKINTSMRRFTEQPAQQGNFGSLLQKVITRSIQSTNYPTEEVVTPIANLSESSSADRDSLIVEKQFPVTSFYLTSRHYYMISHAPFTQDRAYFAGIKEVTFTREHYTSTFDNDLYIENAGDNLNIETNDFDSVDHAWVVYSTTT